MRKDVFKTPTYRISCCMADTILLIGRSGNIILCLPTHKYGHCEGNRVAFLAWDRIKFNLAHDILSLTMEKYGNCPFLFHASTCGFHLGFICEK